MNLCILSNYIFHNICYTVFRSFPWTGNQYCVHYCLNLCLKIYTDFPKVFRLLPHLHHIFHLDFL